MCCAFWIWTDPSFSRLQEVNQSCFKWSHAPAAADLEIVNECCSQRYLLVAIWLCREKLSSWSILHTFLLYLQPSLGWRMANKSCSEVSVEQLSVRKIFFSVFTQPIWEIFLSSVPLQSRLYRPCFLMTSGQRAAWHANAGDKYCLIACSNLDTLWFPF